MIDLSTMTLSERSFTWLKAAGLGEYQHPVYGTLTLNRERLQRLADSVNRRARGISLAVDYAHRQDPSKGHRAAGWIDRAEVRSDGLYLAVSFTDEAKQEIKAGHWKYLSPEFGDWKDPRTNMTVPDTLYGLALTNRPFLRDLGEIAASEDATRRTTDLRVLYERFSTPEGSTGLSDAVDLAEAGFLGLVERRVNQGGMAFSEAADQIAREFPEVYASYRATMI